METILARLGIFFGAAFLFSVAVHAQDVPHTADQLEKSSQLPLDPKNAETTAGGVQPKARVSPRPTSKAPELKSSSTEGGWRNHPVPAPSAAQP
ncbi:MAG: hypothetical protein H7301_01535 [Cryobacterium sp.]|nr:hypothetical protein [Oligoflexia bacterium]